MIGARDHLGRLVRSVYGNVSKAHNTTDLPPKLFRMAPARRLQRIDLFCPEYNTNASIRVDDKHASGHPHLVTDYEKGGYKRAEASRRSISETIGPIRICST